MITHNHCLLCSSWPSVTGVIYVVMHLIFSLDIIISFRVAYTDREAFITDSAAVARNYCRLFSVLSLSSNMALHCFIVCVPRLVHGCSVI